MEKNTPYQEINSSVIDGWVDEGWEWGIPLSHEAYLDARKGKWDVVLTPCIPVPHDWFGDLQGKKILGLASGGGQQMPVFAALGADCTVLDYSEKQLESERMVAKREGYDIRIVRADMTKPLPFENEEFDLVFHPVSNCYVEEVRPIFRECYRVLKKGGILLCGLDNGLNYAFDDEGTSLAFSLPFNPLKNPEHMARLHVKEDGIQFSHTAEEQLGGQLEAGFRLTHIREDFDTEGGLAAHHIPAYYLTRAVKG